MTKTRIGLLLGLLSYLLWGFLSLYWKMLGHLDSYKVFSYRILFTVLTMLVYMILSKQSQSYGDQFISLWREKKFLISMLVTSLLISINWLTYIVAVSHAQAADASLGYYIMPLVSIALSVFVLKEKISIFSRAAITLAALGVILLLVRSGQVPLVSLTLALTFAIYGLLKKGLPVSSDFAMLFEAFCALLVALPYLILQGDNFFSYALKDQLLMGLSGIITAIPLLLFAEGVKRAPLNLIGFIQYINPTIQLLIAVFVYGEVVSNQEWPAFILIWLAIGIFVLSQVKELRDKR